jgi:hypothetical protein
MHFTHLENRIMEKELAEMFSRKRLLASELNPFGSQVCQEAQVDFQGPRSLNKSMEIESLGWAGQHWDPLSPALNRIATN